MKQLSPQKNTPGYTAIANQTFSKGISYPAVSPIQRKPDFQVEPDNLEELPEGIEDQWAATVQQALESLATSSPAMTEIITELQSDRLNVNFILANRSKTEKQAVGKTKNPEVPAIINKLEKTSGDQLEVGHLTAPPQKELIINIYKQKINEKGTTLQDRYKLSHAQIHSTILHELLMHGHPHLEHMKLRESLTERPPRITSNKDELEKYNIPGLYSSLNKIVMAKGHKLMELWEEKTMASMKYGDNKLVTHKEMLIHHANDILEHIAIDDFDESTREELTKELIKISEETKDTNLDQAITDTVRVLYEEVLRSGTKFGVLMSESRKKSIRALHVKFPSVEEKIPIEQESKKPEVDLFSDEESEETAPKIPVTKKIKTTPSPFFIPPPRNTGGNLNPTPTGFGNFTTVNRPSLFDTLPEPKQNTTPTRSSLFGLLPAPKTQQNTTTTTTTTRSPLFSLLPPPKNSGPKKEDDDNKETK